MATAAGTTQTQTQTRDATTPRIALALLLGRVAAVGLASTIAWALVAAAGFASPFPPTPLIACLALIPVNIATLIVVGRLTNLRELIGFDAKRLGKDVAWGLLWIAVLYVPFVLTILGVMFLLHGSAMFERFETVFVPSEFPVFPLALSVVLGAIVVLTFAPLNAPAEEVAYRGIAQPALGIIIPSLLFGAQHVLFAPSPGAMLVYGLAFFVWGLGSALIYRRQGRLMPLIVAHFIVNLAMTLPSLILPLVIPEMTV